MFLVERIFERKVGDAIVSVVRIFAAPEEAEMQVCGRTWCNQRQGRWASSFELGRQRKSLWPRSKPPVSIFATLLPTSSRPTNGKQRRTSSKKHTSSHPTPMEVSCFIFQKTRHPHLLIFSFFPCPQALPLSCNIHHFSTVRHRGPPAHLHWQRI